MKVINNLKLAILTGIILTTVACGSQKETPGQLTASGIIPVKTAQIDRSEHVQHIRATGLVTTANEARYAFKIGGVIDRIYASEGQSFKKGDLLASLKLTEIDAGLTQARLGLEKAERDFNRVNNLYTDSVATLEQLQNAQTALELAQKQLEAVAFNRQHAFIYAANPGFVTKKLANEGEIIAGGHPVLAINENGGTAWVLKAGLSDIDWANVEPGNPATVKIDAFPDREFNAVVSKKSLAADQNSGSFQVELMIETGQVKPAVGMFARAVIQTGNLDQFAAVPYDALIEADGNKAFVFVPRNHSHVEKLPVTIQSFDNISVRLASGLESESEIIVSNSAFLNEKSTIQIVK